MNNPCPICGVELQNTYKDYMDHILMESSWECPNDHYMDEYMTGYTAIWMKPHNNPVMTISWKREPQKIEKFVYKWKLFIAKLYWLLRV